MMVGVYDTMFNSFDSFLTWLQKDLPTWTGYSRTDSGTKDEYKEALIEKTQFFYKIDNPCDVISNFKTFKQHDFWSYGEILSEVFALNPPLMHRYKPEIIEWAYKLRADKSVEYMYGRRWNEWNQVLNTINLLAKRPDSKRAVIDIFTPYDTDNNRADVPCSLMYTFKIRENKLNMTTFFRSHDIFSGLKYDILLSSFMNQLICMGVNATNHDLKIEPGTLATYEDSLHYYPLKNLENYREFVAEKPERSTQKFDFMYSYKTVSEMYDDLWHVMKAEQSSYYGNFKFAEEKMKEIKNDKIKRMAECYYKRNKEFYDKGEKNVK